MTGLPPLRGLSSMATRAVLADLLDAWVAQGGRPLLLESVGGVEAARRVREGEAVRAGAPRPDLSTEDAVRRAVQAAPTIGYSTGPSGTALLRLFERWGLAAELAPRTVQAPPGVPVGALVARGEVVLGFQQLSELMHLPGVDVLGPLPEPIQITTVFSGAVGRDAADPQAVAALLAFLASPATADTKRRHGMAPAGPHEETP